MEIAVIPTGALSLDVAAGRGGVPRGRVVEIYGRQSSGKTTLALHIVSEAQRWAAPARSSTPSTRWIPSTQKARRQHRRAADLPARHGEQALEITETLVRSNAVDVIVIDSVAALVPRAELDGRHGRLAAGPAGALMSQALRKLTPPSPARAPRGIHQPDPGKDRRHVWVFHYSTRVVLADAGPRRSVRS